MAFNFDALLGGFSRDEDLGALAGLLGKRRAAEQGSAPMDPGMGNMPQEQAPADIQVESREPRTGMFGIKGTFRDILGTLGDALLEGTGGDAIYRPHRQGEKYADALGTDVLENPENSIDRLITGGFGKEAGSLAQQVQENQIAKAKADQYKAYQQAQVTEKGQGILGKYMAVLKDDASYQKALPRLKAMAEKYGVDAESIPSKYDDSVNRWGLDPYRSNRLDQFDEKEDNDNRWEEIKERGRMARDNPPAAKSRGATQVDAEILDRVRKGTATPGELQIYKDRLTRAPARGGRRAAPAAGKSGGPPVGYKNKNGLTFKGGDPNDRKNWK